MTRMFPALSICPRLTQVVAAPKDYCRQLLLSQCARRQSLLLSISAVCLWGQIAIRPLEAADFSRAQKTYAPPTQIDRRLDFEALKERQAADSSPPDPSSNLSNTAKQTSKTTPTKKLSSAELAQIRRKADNLIKSGKLAEAQRLLNSAYQSNPADDQILSGLSRLNLLRAQSLLQSKTPSASVDFARQALYLNPSNSAASKLLDQLDRKSGIDPSNLSQRLKLADQLAAEKKNQAAIVEYRSALKIKPNAWAHVGLGNMAVRANQGLIARQEYQSAIASDPNAAYAHRQLGLLNYSSNDVIGANTSLSRALILDPTDKVSGQTLVSLWQQQVTRNPNDANGHMGLARAYQLAGDLQSAQTSYQQAVRLNPNHPNLPAARLSFKQAQAKQQVEQALEAAHTLESQGALAPALQRVSQALAIHPSDPHVLLYQGQLLERMGQVGPAYNAYSAVLRSDSANPLAAQRLRVLSAQLPPVPAVLPASPSEAPPALAGPIIANDQVGQLSSFLFALRNQMLSEQKRDQEIERTTRNALERMTSPSSPPAADPILSDPILAGLAPAITIPGAPTAPLSTDGLRGFAPAAALPQALPQAPPPGSTAATVAAMPPIAPSAVSQPASPAAVHMVLEGVKPSLRTVELQVVLRNDQDVALPLPAKPRVVLRNGSSTQSLKSSFPEETIAAHSQIRGTINIPTRQISASSDIVLLGLGTDQSEVHLTTPISYR